MDERATVRRRQPETLRMHHAPAAFFLYKQQYKIVFDRLEVES
jgi:hypothetical protein